MDNSNIMKYKIVSNYNGNDKIELEVGERENPSIVALETLGWYLVRCQDDEEIYNDVEPSEHFSDYVYIVHNLKTDEIEGVTSTSELADTIVQECCDCLNLSEEDFSVTKQKVISEKDLEETVDNL